MFGVFSSPLCSLDCGSPEVSNTILFTDKGEHKLLCFVLSLLPINFGYEMASTGNILAIPSFTHLSLNTLVPDKYAGNFNLKDIINVNCRQVDVTRGVGRGKPTVDSRPSRKCR